MIFDGVFGVPYTDPVSHMCLSSVLGARPSVQSSCMATSADGDGRSTPFSPDSLGSRSSMTPTTTSGYGDCRSTPTPTATVTGECRSSPTPLVTFTSCAGTYDSIDRASHMRLPLVLGACLHADSSPPPAFANATGHVTPPPLAASTGGGGRSSPGATTSPTSALYFTGRRLWDFVAC